MISVECDYESRNWYIKVGNSKFIMSGPTKIKQPEFEEIGYRMTHTIGAILNEVRSNHV